MIRAFSRESLLTLTTALGVTLLISSPAHPHASCTAAVRSEHGTTRNVITGEHEATRTAIKLAIEEQTADLKEKMEETTQRIILALANGAAQNTAVIQQQTEAGRRIADAQELNETDRMRQQVRAKAESGAFDPNPFSCQLLDIFEAGRGGGAPMSGQGVTQQAVNRINGNDAAVQAGGARVARSVVDARDEFAGFQGSANPTTDWSLMLNEPTIDLSNPDMQGVLGWVVANSVDATPERAMTEAELSTPEGMARAAEAQQRLARQRAAIETINMSLNMRTPVLTDNGTYSGMASDSLYNRPVPESLSELQQLDIQTVYHYAPGPNRLNGTNGEDGLEGMSEKGWLQEIHRITAINARINFIRLELENRSAITSALILAALSDR